MPKRWSQIGECCSLLAILLGTSVLSAVAPGSSGQSAGSRSCVPTPPESLLPANVLGPMTGKSPVWVVDGSAGVWQGADEPVKTLWVFFRESAKSVRIRGRQLDGSGRPRFRSGIDEPISDALTITDPSETSVVPGGATAEVMKMYAFVPTYVFYPSPGCWQFDIGIGDNEFHIVVALR